MIRSNYYETDVCTYCEGDGYVTLLLGGSETCYACKGSGHKKSNHSKTESVS
ncbi:YuiA family protein [Laceyella putida]|uniref:YuiA family protein n=1 Tax=Laceyella putida TaxID=110101 RepID=A0ABW2RFD3_9BACL